MISAITGAGGRLGRRLVRLAAQTEGDEVRQLNAYPGNDYVEVDLRTGKGLREALEGVEVLVHTASSPRRDPWQIDVGGTRRLVNAVDRASLRHLVYISIVGVDRIPYDYYHAKFAAEEVIRASRLPATIVRSTQFHAFVDELLMQAKRGPVITVPAGWQVQPVDVDEVTAHLWATALGDPHDHTIEIAGPLEQTATELARLWAADWFAMHADEGARKPRVIPVRLPGKTSDAFRSGHALPGPGAVVGSMTYAQHLARAASVI